MFVSPTNRETIADRPVDNHGESRAQVLESGGRVSKWVLTKRGAWTEPVTVDAKRTTPAAIPEADSGGLKLSVGMPQTPDAVRYPPHSPVKGKISMGKGSSKKAKRHAAESRMRTRRMLGGAASRSGPVKISYLPGFAPPQPSPPPPPPTPSPPPERFTRTKLPFIAYINGERAWVSRSAYGFEVD